MNEYIKDIDELIDSIKNSDIYINYIELENKVSMNEDIVRLTSEIKHIQKSIVSKNNDNEEELKSKYVELNSIPLYNEYTESMEEFNNLLLIIKNKFDLLVENILLR